MSINKNHDLDELDQRWLLRVRKEIKEESELKPISWLGGLLFIALVIDISVLIGIIWIITRMISYETSNP